MDAAALSLAIDSTSVVKASTDLDKFTASAERAGKAGVGIGNQSGSIAKLVASVSSANAKLSVIIGLLEKTNAALLGNASASQAAAAANDNNARAIAVADAHVIAYTSHLAGLVAAQTRASSATGVADAHVIAYTQNLARMAATATTAGRAVNGAGSAGATAAGALAGAGKNLKLRGDEMLNLSRQASDIGVTLAMGMNPLMVAIQQGPQIADIFQSASQRGIGFKSVLAQIGTAFYALIAPLLPIILAIGAALATIGVGFALGARDIDKGAGDISKSMGLTEKQLERLKKAGVDTTVTIGDTFKAFFEVTGERFAAAFKGPVGAAQKVVTAALDQMATDGANIMRSIAGTFFGGYYAIVALWKTMPTTFAGIGALVANAFIAAFEGLINRIISQVNGINDKINGALKSVGISTQFVKLDNVKIDRVANAEAANTASAVSKGFADGMSAGVKATDRFFKDVRTKAIANRTALIRDAAGDAAKVPKGPKSDAEKLADIYRNAQAEITVQEDRLKAVGMSARAAAELEQNTKILNQVQKAGIPVTSAVTAEIERLAKAYADAKIAADTAVALQGVTDSMVKQSRGITDQIALIGLYGDALNRARITQEALNQARDALPRGEVLSADAEAGIRAGAGSIADKQAVLDQGTRADKVRKDAEDAAYAMDLERKGLGLTGEAAIAYAFAVEQLNNAKRAGTALSEGEIANINAAGAAYAAQRYAIDQQAQAITNAREVTKGFFSEWINGAREGANVFTALGTSAVNALNRIIDKLLDKTLDGFINGMFSGGASAAGGSSGGFFSSLLSSIGLGSKTAAGGSGNGPGVLNIPSTAEMMQGGWKFDLTKNALGGVYGDPQRFANGGAFTNSIVNNPTLFRFANGGSLGEMGEAGPEAIMPLKRGANGALGVQMHGGGRPSIKLGDVTLVNKVDGGFMPDAVMALIRNGGEQTVAQIKRDLQSMLQQLDVDGSSI